MRGLCTAALIVAVTAAAAAAPQPHPSPPQGDPGNIVLERSPQLFAVLCALYAAGFEADVTLASPHPLHTRLRREMAQLQGPAVDALRKFYRAHRTADAAATLSRYVSFALVTGPPPRFDYLLTLEQLPPDVRALDGFAPVLIQFYNEAGIAQRWNSLAADYDVELRRLQQPLGEIVFRTSGYLREVAGQGTSRGFFVYVEPLVGAKTNLRNYGDRYIVALSPGRDTAVSDLRHGFLHFLLDPLPYRYRAAVEAVRPLLAYAQRAPRFSPEYQEQWPEFVTECLVRAVELRLRKLNVAEESEALRAADADGYILVRPLYLGLQKFEVSAPAMSFYFPDLFAGIRVAEEAKRLEKVEFAPARAAGPEISEAVAEIPETERWLAEAERLIADRKPADAANIFRLVLQKEPQNIRATYGAGMAAVLLGEVEQAKGLFRQVVLRGRSSDGAEAAGADPRILAWAHVYLGRIYDVEGNRDLALTEFRAALAVADAPETARAAARRGLAQGYKPAPENPEL